MVRFPPLHRAILTPSCSTRGPIPPCFVRCLSAALGALSGAAATVSAPAPSATFGNAVALGFDPSGSMPPHLAVADGGRKRVYVYPVLALGDSVSVGEPIPFLVGFQVEDITITLGVP